MSIRAQFLAWLLILLLPVAAAELWTLHVFNDTVEKRIGQSLNDSLRLETARISDTLGHYVDQTEALAMDPALRILVAWESAARHPSLQSGVVQGSSARELTGPGSIEPGRFDQMIEDLANKVAANRAEVVELSILDQRGNTIASSPEFSWTPADDTLVVEAMTAAQTLFGDAYREPRWGRTRLGMTTPIMSPSGVAVGALLLETRLDPIIGPIAAHEQLARTSEVHIAQPTPHGDAAFITPLRFDPDAAFSRIVSVSANTGINMALESPTPQLLRMKDYRGVPSVLAVATLAETGWGVVVKIDESEAFAPVAGLRVTALLSTLATVLLIIVAWLVLLNPLGKRLKQMSSAAERIAAGRLDTFVGDPHHDEIGDTARTIDRLASELEADRQQREAAEAQLRHQATHDELTGLHNRKHANAVIEDLTELPGTPASIIFMDLDGFKPINDQHGHGAGDEILIELADRLAAAMQENATLARWGGDEFVVILPDTERAAAAKAARQIRSIFDTPFSTPSGIYEIDCSLGFSTSSSQRSLDEVLSIADREMYAEKHQRRNANSVEAYAARTVAAALDEQRVELWLQPIASIPAPGEVRLAGAEALVRLRSRDGGVINPTDFLAAVRTGPLGSALDTFVLERAIHSLSRWRRIGLVDKEFSLSINVTGASLRRTELAREIATMLTRYEVPAPSIVIEISEQTGDIDTTPLELLRELGVKIALDDVGLHRSNLDRLVALAPDVAKLDRQWMNDDVVLPRLIDLCHSLGLELVAEGVETEDQLALLQRLAVSRFQGYWFDRPRPAVQFIQRWGRFTGSRDTTVDTRATSSVTI